jgi:glycosyltransferase involved in cell wall biosynthesis
MRRLFTPFLDVKYCWLEMANRIFWAFSIGHGHATQFHNFRESCSPEVEARSHWIGMDFAKSGDPLSRLSLVPAWLKHRRNEMWYFRQALRKGIARDDVLFVASWNLRFVSYMMRFRSYIYVDFSPSLMRQLSPWYDHFRKKSATVQQLRDQVSALFPRTAHGVFTMSNWCARGVVADYGVDRARVHTVLPGANLAKWRFVDRARRSGPVRVLMVGGEFHRKGGDLLLDWAETRRGRNVEVDIVTWPGQLPARAVELLGHPDSSGKISRWLAPWLPNVRVHCGLQPNSPELQRLFAEADIFCLPTRGDFSSIASLEAMASGLPVVVGAVGGIPELVDDGKNGFLVEPGNPRALADRLDLLVEDAPLRTLVGVAARKRCEEHLNTDRQIREIVAVMDKDAKAPSRPS